MSNPWNRRALVAALALAMAVIQPWVLLHGSAPAARAEAPSRQLPKMMTPETVKSIDKALEYLARSQQADGAWGSSGPYGSYPAVMTSLAGLSMLAAGSTPETGKYAKNVRKAMLHILRLGERNPDGMICGEGSEGRSMYGHGFGTLFLAQCYGMDLDKDTAERIQKVLDKGVALTVRAQSDLGPKANHAGGWIYTPDPKNGDEGSVTVTQLQALRACRNVGIKVPKQTIDRAVAYLKHTQNADGGISYSAASRGGSRPAISAAAIACFYAAGVYDRQTGAAESEESKMVEKLVEYCRRNINVNRADGHYYYTQFYMAQAWYQRGGADWEKYYPEMRDKLLKDQGLDGSWMGDGVGKTYGTAIALMILQMPYGYLPIFQK